MPICVRREGQETCDDRQCPKCGGKRIEMWLCLREAICTARPRCESSELRQPPLPFDADYHAHRRCLDCGAEWASPDLGLDP